MFGSRETGVSEEVRSAPWVPSVELQCCSLSMRCCSSLSELAAATFTRYFRRQTSRLEESRDSECWQWRDVEKLTAGSICVRSSPAQNFYSSSLSSPALVSLVKELQSLTSRRFIWVKSTSVFFTAFEQAINKLHIPLKHLQVFLFVLKTSARSYAWPPLAIFSCPVR